ncbi:MAG: hypothetical protein D6702_10680 [Planctomycetota bacterium]|nr:MAG: hypothetical protein D6702_10680 [Planctomycetota bacterium]
MQGGVCSRQALIIERIDGTQILSCGNNCLGGDCRLHYIVRPDGLLLMACEVLNCSYCSVDSNERRCLCEG